MITFFASRGARGFPRLFLSGVLLMPVAVAAQSPAPRPQPDEIAAICFDRGGSVERCACEGRIARASFTPKERRAAIAGLSGQEQAFRKALDALGPGPGRAFMAKLKTLGERARRECR